MASPRNGGAHSLAQVYARLDAAYGGETWHWSPDYARSPMDVVAGAILVQHTTWANAERALDALREAGAVDCGELLRRDASSIEALIRVSGTPTVKARRLRALATTIESHGGLAAFLSLPKDVLRATLLATHGVGPETADAIVLYAAGHASFVIDAYTRRLFGRLRLGPGDGDSYDAWQRHFQSALPADAALYRRYHAWIVLHGKRHCRATPRCDGCPLSGGCPSALRQRRPVAAMAAV